MALIHHWRMDDASAATVEDSAGSAPLTVTGSVPLVTGVYGNARRLSGAYPAADWAEATAPAALRTALLSDATVAFWYKLASGGYSYPYLFQVAGDTGGGAYDTEANNTLFGISLEQSARTLYCDWETTGGASGSDSAPNGTILLTIPNDSAWHHIAIVRSLASTTHTATAYLDGAVQGSVAGDSAVGGSSASVRIGSSYAAGVRARMGAGDFDDVRVYDTALSAADIATLARAPVTLKNCAEDLVTAMTTQTLGGVYLVSGRNLFAEIIPADPSMAVFLLNAGGEPPEPYCGSDSQSFFNARVVLMVRGVAGSVGYADAETLARAVLGWLHLRSVSGYIAIRAVHPHPDFIGPDDNGRPQWTAHLDCWFKA